MARVEKKKHADPLLAQAFIFYSGFALLGEGRRTHGWVWSSRAGREINFFMFFERIINGPVIEIQSGVDNDHPGFGVGRRGRPSLN